MMTHKPEKVTTGTSPIDMSSDLQKMDLEKKEIPEIHLLVYASADGSSDFMVFGTAVSKVDWPSIGTKYEAVSDKGVSICGNPVTHHFRTTQPDAVRQEIQRINEEEHLHYEVQLKQD